MKDRSSPAKSDQLLLNTRFALLIGFGGLLVIMALAGLDGLLVLRRVRRDDDQIRQQFLLRNDMLNSIRSDLYVSGTYLRDYLLEPDAGRAETYRSDLEQVRKNMRSALDSYKAQVRPADAAEYAALEKELSYYWQSIEPSLQWSAADRQRQGYAFLRDQVFPRREAMLAVAGRISAINEAQLNAGSLRVDSLLTSFQIRLVITLFAALSLGLVMALFTSRRILRLEASASAQFHEVAEARTQLKDLSARLVEMQESERRALSRELHDEVGQSLFAILVELRNVAAELGTIPVELSRQHVNDTKSLVEATAREVRNMALLLRPSMLDDLGLVPALKWQAREMSKRTSIEVSVATELLSDDYPDEYKTCVYRVVQEALHNCCNHSQATQVRIRVQEEPGRLSLVIQDDGRGFQPMHTKGLGLLGIEERVAHLGGQFNIYSNPGSGTVLSIQLPITAREPGENGRRHG